MPDEPQEKLVCDSCHEEYDECETITKRGGDEIMTLCEGCADHLL